MQHNINKINFSGEKNINIAFEQVGDELARKTKLIGIFENCKEFSGLR